MQLSTVQKRLFRKALYTSPLMAVPSLSPILVRYEISFIVFVYAIVIQSVVVYCIWSVNIGLLSLTFGQLSEQKSKIIRYVISYSFALLVILLLREFLLLWVESSFFPVERNEVPRLYRPVPYYGMVLSFSLNTVILIIQDVITIKEKKAIADLENSQLKLKNAEIINQHLKQQIHPHFLFNALNTLKTLIRNRPMVAEDYLIRLSNFLRISVSANKMNTVKLEDELSICIDYLEMQKTRFGNTLRYGIYIPEEKRKRGMVPIFSIQLLLENAIKHNAMYRDSPLIIELRYEEPDRIRVTNNIQERESKELSTSYGLDNLAERYRILSGDQIIIKANRDTFSVSIKILGHENRNY